MNLPLVLKNIIMKKVILMVSIISRMFSLAAQQTDYSRYPVYNGNDLGLTYSKVKSVFKIWSPVAEKAQLLLYSDGFCRCRSGQTPSLRRHRDRRR